MPNPSSYPDAPTVRDDPPADRAPWHPPTVRPLGDLAADTAGDSGPGVDVIGGILS
jgi:hypothetical protein